MPEDKYYEGDQTDDRVDEEMDGQEENYDYADQNDAPEDSELDKLLDFLIETLTVAPAVPLSSGKRMVSLQMCLDIVEDIRNCLPDEIRYSTEILKKRDRILRDAQSTAESKVQAADARANAAIDDANRRAQEIVAKAEDHAREIEEQAQMRARAMIDQSEIMRLAHEEAAQLCEEARADANDQRLKATRYSEDLLEELERDVQATLDAVRRSIQNISGPRSASK